MALERLYLLTCDGCKTHHTSYHATPRRARAAARRDGWQRRNMGEWVPVRHDPIRGRLGGFQHSGPYRDFCEKCVEAMDKQEEASDETK